MIDTRTHLEKYHILNRVGLNEFERSMQSYVQQEINKRFLNRHKIIFKLVYKFELRVINPVKFSYQRFMWKYYYGHISGPRNLIEDFLLNNLYGRYQKSN